ncbi:hypothetical protein BD309DRAFT_962366 [Dichomitus squalens]|nr:hypothetical protein BD309DRAFT_962366 [Dichomitus squalens]
MGLGKVVAAAAAAAPLLRDRLHYQYDRVHQNPEDDGWEDQDRTPTVATAPQPLPRPQTVSQILAGRPSETLPQTASPEPEPVVAAEEMARKPLLGVDTHVTPRQSAGFSPHGDSNGKGGGQSYGAVLDEGGPSRLRQSPERYRSNSWLDRVPEEAALDGDAGEDDAEADDWDLAQQGYYSGSYKRTIALYAFVPLTSLLVFLALALAPTWLWPVRWPSPPSFPRSFPSPLPEFTLAAALWSLSHLLRTPLWTLSAPCPRPLDTLLFNLLHVLLSNVLRLAAFATLRVRHDMAYPRPTWRDGAFRTVWWTALGWAAAEAAASVAQGYAQLALYRNVMVPVERVQAILARARGWGGEGGVALSNDASREYMPLSPRSAHGPSPPGDADANANGHGSGKGIADEANGGEGRGPRRAGPTPMSLEEAIRLAVDQDVEQLIHLQEREELEEVYGVPVIYIPVFVPCLQRIDSFLFSLGFTLILAWAYLLSPLSFPPGADTAPIYSNHALAIAFPVVVVVHLFLSLLHSPPILPRIGVHTTAYVGLLVGLGGFFAGLGLWGVLS